MIIKKHRLIIKNIVLQTFIIIIIDVYHSCKCSRFLTQ